MKLSPSIHSLRSIYLRGMLWVLLPTLLIGTTLSYFYAFQSIQKVYDLDLLDDANDLVHQVQLHESELVLDLPLAARQMLLSNNEESVIYAVWDEKGTLLSGNPHLLEFAKNMKYEGSYQFRTVNFSGHDHRMICMQDAVSGRPIYVAVAETTAAINQLLLHVFIGFVFLGLLLTLFSVIGIVLGVRRGLVPIEKLRSIIAHRLPQDFSALPEETAPLELRPIIHGVNELLEKLEKSVLDHRRFVTDAAHQLRTPLAVLRSKLEVALSHPAENNTALLQQLFDITLRTSHLASQLLSLSRVENSGLIETNFTAVDLPGALREITANFVVPAEKNHIRLNFKMSPCSVYGDRILLQELFANLLDNAIRYSGSGSHVDIALEKSGSLVQLSISDNGVGVSADGLAKLGQPFFRGNTADAEGCGLGLAIVMEIVKLHKASLTFSVPANGKGLRVIIFLPAI